MGKKRINNGKTRRQNRGYKLSYREFSKAFQGIMFILSTKEANYFPHDNGHLVFLKR